MPDAASANKAIEKLNGYEIAGKRIQVTLCSIHYSYANMWLDVGEVI